MQTIEKLWKKLEKVELVQVRPSEMELLYKHCFEFENPNIVEVGSAHGASSIILASAAKELGGKLFCIDPYPEDYLGQEKFGKYARREFIKNMKPYNDVYTHFEMPSIEAFGISLSYIPFDILFIDGDHSYEGVSNDCHVLLGNLKSGGYVGFHDYNNNAAFPGVRQAADAFCDGWQKESEWDLVVFKKP